MKPSLPSPGVSRRVLLAALAAAPALPQLLLPTTVRAQVPAAALASWNDTASRQAIVTFVQRVTGQGSPDFMPPAERIATFDNDGTLWCEHPMYVHRKGLGRAAGASRGLLDQDEVPDARWRAGAVPFAGGEFHRRRGGQAGRHQ